MFLVEVDILCTKIRFISYFVLMVGTYYDYQIKSKNHLMGKEKHNFFALITFVVVLISFDAFAMINIFFHIEAVREALLKSETINNKQVIGLDKMYISLHDAVMSRMEGARQRAGTWVSTLSFKVLSCKRCMGFSPTAVCVQTFTGLHYSKHNIQVYILLPLTIELTTQVQCLILLGLTENAAILFREKEREENKQTKTYHLPLKFPLIFKC